MPISQTQYTDITSVVGGAAATSARNLVLRLVTTNELLPTNSLVKFTSSDSVKSYFGSSSDEGSQSAQYFNLVTKDGRQAKEIQFVRWADMDTSAQVFGSPIATLAQLKTYAAAAFDVTLDGSTFNITALDLSGAADLAAVASLIETKLKAADASLADVTVEYDATRKGFNLDTLGVADGAISFTAVTANLLNDLGWGSPAIYSEGVAAQSLTDMISDSTALDNNFHTFCTIDQLVLDQHEDLSAWSNGRNNEFHYLIRTIQANYAIWSAALIDYAGSSITLYDVTVTDEYPWLQPAAVIAANVWTDQNAAMNLMFTQDSTLTATVSTDSVKEVMDAARVNYFGVTQFNGTNLTFYQKGLMMGGSTAPIQMGVYSAEAWFKSYISSQLMNLLLAVKIISADEVGQSQVATTVGGSIDLALFNGMISVGKALTDTQKAYITSISGDSNAWQRVQGKGFWLTTGITSSTSGGVTDYTATYTLIYATREGVSKVEGRDILI